MTELDKDTFDAAVLAHKGVYLVDFWSETCETCAAMMPEIETLERELAGRAAFGKVNLQGNRRLAIREKVMSLPTVVVYRDGEKVQTLPASATQFEDTIEPVIPCRRIDCIIPQQHPQHEQMNSAVAVLDGCRIKPCSWFSSRIETDSARGISLPMPFRSAACAMLPTARQVSFRWVTLQGFPPSAFFLRQMHSKTANGASACCSRTATSSKVLVWCCGRMLLAIGMVRICGGFVWMNSNPNFLSDV